MNTKKLKLEHQATYNKFMAKNDTIFSLPFVINWAGNEFNQHGGVSIKQKIPLRMYFGIKNTFGDLECDEIIIYNHEIGVFENTSKNSISYLDVLLNSYKKDYNLSGIKVSILSEIPMAYGLGFNGILNSLANVAFSQFVGKISIDEIKQCSSCDINMILHNSNLGEEIKINNKKTISSGKVGFPKKPTCFFNGKFPVVEVKRGSDHNLQFFYYPLNKLISKNNPYYKAPLDTSLVYSGIPSCMEFFDYNSNDLEDRTNLGIERLLKVVDKVYFDSSGEVVSLLNNQNIISKEVIHKNYNDLIDYVGLEVLYKFIDVIEGNNTENQQSSLILALNKKRLSSFITKKYHNKTKNILDKLYCFFGLGFDELAIHTNDPIVTGGTILINSKLDQIRSKLKKTNFDFEGGMVNYFNSFEDGREEFGLIIEKNEIGLVGNSIVLHSNDGNIKQIDANEVESEIFNYDFIFDTLTGKIINKNKKLSSKDVFSQQTTVELFQKIICSNKKTVSNKELYKSSYTQTKSEMQSKIIKPFLKYCEKVYGKDFIELSLSGSSSNYTISLLTNLSYGVIYRQTL